jgi:hypothetical protein
MKINYKLTCSIDKATANAIVQELYDANVYVKLIEKNSPEDCFSLEIDLTNESPQECFILGACIEDVVIYNTSRYYSSIGVTETSYNVEFKIPFKVSDYATLDI